MRTNSGDAASGVAGDKPAYLETELELFGGKKELLRSFDTYGSRLGTIYGLIDEDELWRRRKRLDGGQTYISGDGAEAPWQ